MLLLSKETPPADWEIRMNTYKVNGETKFWKTGRSAVANAIKLNQACGYSSFWATAWEYEKGWFLEDLFTAEEAK
jgi:hypothetical protein